MKLLKKCVMILLALGLFSSFGCYRYRVQRQPRVIVDTIRTPRCFGKVYTYPCRHPDGHVKREIMRCRRYGRMFVRRRRWIVRDDRCHDRRRRYVRRRRVREVIP